MPEPKLTEQARIMLILMGRTLEQLVLDVAVKNADGNRVDEHNIREAFRELTAEAFRHLPDAVDASARRLRVFQDAA